MRFAGNGIKRAVLVFVSMVLVVVVVVGPRQVQRTHTRLTKSVPPETEREKDPDEWCALLLHKCAQCPTRAPNKYPHAPAPRLQIFA